MNRITYLDSVKAFGMFLVFYTHFVQRLWLSGSHAAFIHRKLTAAVVVQLFFFLSGIFWKPNENTFLEALRTKFLTRLVPVLFFGALAVPLFYLMKPDLAPGEIGKRAYDYLFGFPSLNWVTWFLVCLFTVEIIMTVFSRYFSCVDRKRAFWYAAGFFILGYFATGEPGTRLGQVVLFDGTRLNFWLINEAIMASAFFLFGYAMRDVLSRPVQFRKDVIIMAVSGLAFLATFNLNKGPFRDEDVVLMVFSSHGNTFLFLFTSAAGIIFILYFFRLVPMVGAISRFVGANTLIYMGLNGFCFHFFDKRVIKLIGILPTSRLGVLIYCTAYSCLIMTAFAPIIFVLKRYLPEFVGSGWTDTSLIPRMGALKVGSARAMDKTLRPKSAVEESSPRFSLPEE